MKKLSALEPLVFYALLVTLLVPVWAVDFFVTGDGPCHLHNSKILLDWWQGTNRSFYDPFYFLNTNFDPNWLFNLITAPLLGIFGPEWAERIFFTGYVLGFGLGFRFLISEINPKAKFISSIGLLFCYHRLVMMGFLNNALSFALWFWVAGWWWRKRNEFGLGTMLINALLILVLYLAHPMGLTFCMMMIGSLMLGLFLFESRDKGWKESRQLFFQRFKGLVISALPTLVLFIEFIVRQNFSSEAAKPELKSTLEGIGRLSALETMNFREHDLAIATAVVCFLIFLGGIALRLRERRLMPADGLILFIGFVLYSILNPPSSISGGLEVSIRMAMIPFVALLCWAATAIFPLWSQVTGQFAALAIGIGFVAARLPVHRQASAYASEIYACNPYIKDPASVMVLNYDWTGQTPEGKAIADKIWMFTHVDCYLGISRSAAISDNYEAHFSYFPMIARWNTNMYTQTDKDGVNFDHRPPRADILRYKQRSGQDIDYVLMISYRDEFKDDPYTQEIFAQLEQGYEKVFTSSHERAILYKRKGI